MARHCNFTAATRIPIFFRDPHSPWQRGSNENSGGLLRQYLSKSTDLSAQSANDLLPFSEASTDAPERPSAIACRKRNQPRSLRCLLESAHITPHGVAEGAGICRLPSGSQHSADCSEGTCSLRGC
jgi:hypothetical protein